MIYFFCWCFFDYYAVQDGGQIEKAEMVTDLKKLPVHTNYEIKQYVLQCIHQSTCGPSFRVANMRIWSATDYHSVCISSWKCDFKLFWSPAHRHIFIRDFNLREHFSFYSVFFPLLTSSSSSSFHPISGGKQITKESTHNPGKAEEAGKFQWTVSEWNELSYQLWGI